MSPSRIRILLSPSQRRIVNRYKEVYGLSISKLGVLAFTEFFAAHPLSAEPQTYQFANTPEFATVDELLAYMEAQKNSES